MTFGRHSLDLLQLAIVLLGPLPLCLALCDEPQNRRPWSHAILGLLVAWCTLQMALGLLLGWLGWLRLGPAILGESLLLGIGGALVIRRRPDMSVLAPAWRLAPAEWFIVAVILTLGGTLLLLLAMEPITNYDSLAYHLTLMARWYQGGSFVRPERYDEVTYYPFGWEVVCTLFLLPFREDFLVTLPNLLAWAILGLGVLRVGLLVGASRLHALAAVFCVLSIPVVRRQVPTMHVDLALASFFVAGVGFAMTYGRSRSRRDLALFLAALGLVMGIKISGIVYGIMLVGALILVWQRSAGSGWRWLPLSLIPPALLIGVFWYARNLRDIGNPIGLVHVAMFGNTLFPGPLEPSTLARSTLASLFDPRRPDDWRVIGTVVKGSLRLPFLLLATATLALLYRLRPIDRRILALLLLLTGSAWAYAVTPYSGVISATQTRITPWLGDNLRFALPCLAMLGATASLGATRVVGLVVTISAVFAALAGAISSLMLVPAVLIALAGVATRANRRPAVAAGWLACLTAVVLSGSFWLRTYRDDERHRLYGPMMQVVARELQGGGTVAHVITARSYLFYGTDLSNRVVFIPATGDDRDAWVSALRAQHVVLVAAGPFHPGLRRGPELAWLADPAGRFERIAGENPGRETILYRLKSGS